MSKDLVHQQLNVGSSTTVLSAAVLKVIVEIPSQAAIQNKDNPTPFQQTHVTHHHVDLIVNVGLLMDKLHALAEKTIKDVRQTVDQNVLSIKTVLMTRLACRTGVKIHVEVLAVIMLNVKCGTIRLNATVFRDTLVIHLVDVS